MYLFKGLADMLIDILIAGRQALPVQTLTRIWPRYKLLS